MPRPPRGIVARDGSIPLVSRCFVPIRWSRSEIPWRWKAAFLALAVRMMRRLLVDAARARSTGKRGGRIGRVSLGDASGTSFALDSREGSPPTLALKCVSSDGGPAPLPGQLSVGACAAAMITYSTEPRALQFESELLFDGGEHVGQIRLSRVGTPRAGDSISRGPTALLAAALAVLHRLPRDRHGHHDRRGLSGRGARAPRFLPRRQPAPARRCTGAQPSCR